MTLKQAIQRAKRIECSIHVTEGWSHQARVSKKDALLACEDYLKQRCFSWEQVEWENEQGSLIAFADGLRQDRETIECLTIGR
jgi:hypothetical protein